MSGPKQAPPPPPPPPEDQAKSAQRLDAADRVIKELSDELRLSRQSYRRRLQGR